MALPDDIKAILDKKAFAHVATVSKDGTPQVTPVWIDSDDGHVVFNTAEGRVKHRNLERDPRIGISLVDPDNPYHMVSIQGRVVEMTTEDADAHIDELANKYMGVDAYPNRREDEVRVIVRVQPENIVG